MAIPKASAGAQITVSYKNLNNISSLSQLPIPCADQVRNCVGKGRIFSLYDCVMSFQQITPSNLYKWLVMPQGSSASLAWFVKALKEVT